jgi:hypothetical protein
VAHTCICPVLLPVFFPDQQPAHMLRTLSVLQIVIPRTYVRGVAPRVYSILKKSLNFPKHSRSFWELPVEVVSFFTWYLVDLPLPFSTFPSIPLAARLTKICASVCPLCLCAFSSYYVYLYVLLIIMKKNTENNKTLFGKGVNYSQFFAGDLN